MNIRLHLCLFTLLFLITTGWAAAKEGDAFGPVSQDELKMTSEPLAPGAPAIILYREVDRDDAADQAHDYHGHERNYKRIKILTEEGRKYADIEIPFVKGEGRRIAGIKARTIHSDGTVINFEGEPFEKQIVKAKGVKYLAKTFTMPDVQIGSIIEYEYTEYFSEYYVNDSRWILSDELFTKSAKFTLHPYERFALAWTWNRLPAGTEPPKNDRNRISMVAKNIPAFPTEDYMPPIDELKSRVDFTYSETKLKENKNAELFWKEKGIEWHKDLEYFVNKRKAMEDALGQIVSPSDSPEVKLQKIYARVQQIRNTSFEASKSEQERKREKLKEAGSAEDVLKRGYGTGRELTWLFLALTRAAGFDAYGVWVSDRKNYFFNPALMEDSKLRDENVVLVKLNGKDLYFDPGYAFTPFGLLPWSETNVPGRLLNKDGGAWITTPLPNSSASRIDHKADLRVTETGDLEGSVTMTLAGLEASRLRMEERFDDEAGRKKFLVDMLKEQIPASCEVQLTNQPDWQSSSPTFVAEYKLKVPGWLATAGRRSMLPVGLFTAAEKGVFAHTQRTHPMYFQYPYSKEDDLKIALPLGWQVGSLPAAQNEGEGSAVHYSLKAEKDGSTVHINRKMKLDLVFVKAELYPAVRSFFEIVRTGDEQQAVLQPIAGTTSAK